MPVLALASPRGQGLFFISVSPGFYSSGGGGHKAGQCRKTQCNQLCVACPWNFFKKLLPIIYIMWTRRKSGQISGFPELYPFRTYNYTSQRKPWSKKIVPEHAFFPDKLFLFPETVARLFFKLRIFYCTFTLFLCPWSFPPLSPSFLPGPAICSGSGPIPDSEQNPRKYGLVFFDLRPIEFKGRGNYTPLQFPLGKIGQKKARYFSKLFPRKRMNDNFAAKLGHVPTR